MFLCCSERARTLYFVKPAVHFSLFFQKPRSVDGDRRFPHFFIKYLATSSCEIFGLFVIYSVTFLFSIKLNLFLRLVPLSAASTTKIKRLVLPHLTKRSQLFTTLRNIDFGNTVCIIPSKTSPNYGTRKFILSKNRQNLNYRPVNLPILGLNTHTHTHTHRERERES